jgi:hypothetical protein
MEWMVFCVDMGHARHAVFSNCARSCLVCDERFLWFERSFNTNRKSSKPNWAMGRALVNCELACNISAAWESGKNIVSCLGMLSDR